MRLCGLMFRLVLVTSDDYRGLSKVKFLTMLTFDGTQKPSKVRYLLSIFSDTCLLSEVGALAIGS